MKGYLPADYIQLGMCTLLYNTTFCVIIEYMLINVYGVRPQGVSTEEVIHHVVQMDKSVHI